MHFCTHLQRKSPDIFWAETILEKLCGRISYTFCIKCDLNETLDLEIIKGKLTLITHFFS